MFVMVSLCIASSSQLDCGAFDKNLSDDMANVPMEINSALNHLVDSLQRINS